MSDIITDEDCQRALDTMRDNAGVTAKRRAYRLYLERYEKHLVATTMKRKAAEHNGPKPMSIAEQEREAYADESYLTHIKGYQVAVEDDERARFKMLSSQTDVEVWRTQQANNRRQDKSFA